MRENKKIPKNKQGRAYELPPADLLTQFRWGFCFPEPITNKNQGNTAKKTGESPDENVIRRTRENTATSPQIQNFRKPKIFLVPDGKMLQRSKLESERLKKRREKLGDVCGVLPDGTKIYKIQK